VITALGFYDFARVWIFINLQLTGLATANFGLDSCSAPTRLWIKQIDDVLEAVAVFCEQITQLGFQLNFFFEPCVALEGFQCLKLFGEVFFKLAEFCEFGHDRSRLDR